MQELTSQHLVERIETELDELKAENITVLPVGHLTQMTDYMVIATARSTRHASAVADKLVNTLKAEQIRPLVVEGTETSEWILVDFNGAILHIMLPTTRDFYALEKLWDISEAEDDTTDTGPSAQQS